MSEKELNLKSGEKEISEKEIQEIERLTGGKIGTHTFGPHDDVLENSFLSPSGMYIGNLDSAKWYVKNKMMVNEEYPHGVATVITEETYGTETPEIKGMYGYTHRGGNLFKIGDRLFDEGYKPKKEDYDPKEWIEWENNFKSSYDRGDDLDRRYMEASGISYVIPFKLRGKKIIENMEEAFEAAKNMSNYLS
jgi:hypothetical protein